MSNFRFVCLFNKVFVVDNQLCLEAFFFIDKVEVYKIGNGIHVLIKVMRLNLFIAWMGYLGIEHYVLD